MPDRSSQPHTPPLGEAHCVPLTAANAQAPERISPEGVLEQYLLAAMRDAVYQPLPAEGTVLGTIPGFLSVAAERDTEAECALELAATLRDWVGFRLELHLALPALPTIRIYCCALGKESTSRST